MGWSCTFCIKIHNSLKGLSGKPPISEYQSRKDPMITNMKQMLMYNSDYLLLNSEFLMVILQCSKKIYKTSPTVHNFVIKELQKTFHARRAKTPSSFWCLSDTPHLTFPSSCLTTSSVQQQTVKRGSMVHWGKKVNKVHYLLWVILRIKYSCRKLNERCLKVIFVTRRFRFFFQQ